MNSRSDWATMIPSDAESHGATADSLDQYGAARALNIARHWAINGLSIDQRRMVVWLVIEGLDFMGRLLEKKTTPHTRRIQEVYTMYAACQVEI
jgi:hypothetical protein